MQRVHRGNADGVVAAVFQLVQTFQQQKASTRELITATVPMIALFRQLSLSRELSNQDI